MPVIVTRVEMDDEPLVDVPTTTRGTRTNVRNLIVVNIIVGVLTCSTKIYEPVIGQYVYHRVADEVFGNDSRIKNYSVLAPCFQNTSDPGYVLVQTLQERSSSVMWHFSLVGGLIASVVNIGVGSYSDVVGRKFIFITCMLGQLLRNAITSVIIGLHLSIDYFYIVSSVDGLFGGSWGLLLLAYAYIADNTPPLQIRSFGILLLECMNALAEAAASTAAGYFIVRSGFFYPSLLACCVTVFGIFLVAVCLTETVVNTNTNQSRCSYIFNVYYLFIKEGRRRQRLLLWVGLGAFFFSVISTSSEINVDLLFLMNQPFCWSPFQNGIYDTVSTVVRRTVGAGVVKGLQRCISDEVLGVLGSVFVILGDIVFSIATSGWMLYLAFPGIGLIGFLVSPIARGIMSKLVPPQRHGAVFASLAVVESLSSALGAVTFNNIYTASVAVWGGAVYAAMAASHFLALWFFLAFRLLNKDGIPFETT
ncbi:lysosomal proton-coupled steroid conjugate and bile acid symporter SLC46A3-like [Haliotis cracherodii]|uniref:lysosomal proton-coupled steroid conjugate and bile acid symporter SLC46A3-like n=1 Tax=Haliotis cracherodii TaxID=6455 RepID=UPI0039EB0F2C